MPEATKNKPLFEAQDLIGQKVIVRDNNFEDPHLVGILIGWDTQLKVPMIEDGQHRTWYVNGVIIPYSKPIEDMLLNLDPKGQWQLLSKLYQFVVINYIQTH